VSRCCVVCVSRFWWCVSRCCVHVCVCVVVGIGVVGVRISAVCGAVGIRPRNSTCQ